MPKPSWGFHKNGWYALQFRWVILMRRRDALVQSLHKHVSHYLILYMTSAMGYISIIKSKCCNQRLSLLDCILSPDIGKHMAQTELIEIDELVNEIDSRLRGLPNLKAE